MKLLKTVAAILLFTQASFGVIGVESGGGGDPQAVDFLLKTQVVAAWIQDGGGSLPEEKQQNVASIAQRLSVMMDDWQQTPIVMVDRNLVDASGASKVALFSIQPLKVLITRAKWTRLSEEEKYVTAGLELLGMAQVKERYKVAGMIQNNIQSVLRLSSTIESSNRDSASKSMPDRIKAGDRVIDSENDVGKVIEAYDNGKAIVKMDNATGVSTHFTDYLGKSTRCYSGICVGDQVLNSHNEVLKVIEVYDNGKAIVTFKNTFGTFMEKASYLAKKVKCSANICVGDKVVDNGNQVATILEAYNNGKVKLTYQSAAGEYFVYANTLGKLRN